MVTKKKIEALEWLKEEKSGKRIQARVLDQTLIVDCYIDRVPVARYKLKKNGYYEIFRIAEQGYKGTIKAIEGPGWRNQGIGTAFEEDTWSLLWSSKVKASESTNRMIGEFLNTDDMGIRAIRMAESDYRKNKREQAEYRKRERIDQLMDRVPCLPDDIEEWAKETVFQGKQYMFLTDKEKNQYFCTACGKMHTRKRGKEGEYAVCKRTGKEAKIVKRQKKIEGKSRIMVLSPMDAMMAAARHFRVVSSWGPNGQTIEFYEDIRYIIGKGWNKGNIQFYYGQECDADEFEQSWNDRNPINRRTGREYLYPGGVEQALEGSKYQNVPYGYMARNGYFVKYNDLMIYDEYIPAYEYIVKAGLRCLAEEIPDQMWREMVKLDGKNVREVFDIDQQRYQRLKKENGNIMFLEWLQEEERTGKKIPDETIRWMQKNKIHPEDLQWIFDRMSPTKCMNYLEREKGDCEKKAKELISLWEDYLRMAAAEGMDELDEIVYKPKGLVARHDELAELRNAKMDQERVVKLKEKYKDIEAIMERIRPLYEYQGDYTVMVPKDIQSIVQEGRKQHHCVAASDQYFRKIEEGKSYILFLRRNEMLQEPYYTLEVEPNGAILQARSEFNRQPDYKKVNKFLNEWKREIKKRMELRRVS